MSTLYDLVVNQQWQVAITHIQSLAYGDAADQIFFQDSDEWTVIMIACYDSAPLELV